MNPNLAKLRAAVVKNKAAFGVLGAVAVAGLAWRARTTSGGGSDTSAPAAAGRTSTLPGYYSTGGQSGAATGYDSTASDVYNAIQPQLEELTRLWESAKTPTPVPAAPEVQTYVRKTGTERVYAAMSDGTLKTIDRADWLAAGSPQWEDLAATDPVWTRPPTPVPPPVSA